MASLSHCFIAQERSSSMPASFSRVKNSEAMKPCVYPKERKISFMSNYITLAKEQTFLFYTWLISTNGKYL